MTNRRAAQSFGASPSSFDSSTHGNSRGFWIPAIFFRPIKGGIEVVRVIPGDRDIRSL